MKTINKLLFGLLLLLTINPTVQAAEVTIKDEQKIIIGFDDTFAPFGFKDTNGKIVGFDIDLAEKVLGKMNVAYEFQPIDWSTKETELTTGNIDAIWNGYSITPEREKLVQFSTPYVENRQVIIVKAESDIQSKGDLAGKVVATQAESSSLVSILKDTKFVQSIDGGEPITYATFVEVFADLDNGRADAIVVDEKLAAYFLIQRDNGNDYRILEDNFGEEFYAVGFRKADKAFVERFNEALAQVIDEGEFEKIEAKWFEAIDKD